MSDLSAPTEPEPLRLGAVLRQTGTILWRIGGKVTACYAGLLIPTLFMMSLHRYNWPEPATGGLDVTAARMARATYDHESEMAEIAYMLMAGVLTVLISVPLFAAGLSIVHRQLENSTSGLSADLDAGLRRARSVCVCALLVFVPPMLGLNWIWRQFHWDSDPIIYVFGALLAFQLMVFSIASAAIVIEGMGPLAALKHTYALTWRRRFPTLVVFATLLLAAIALIIVGGLLIWSGGAFLELIAPRDGPVRFLSLVAFISAAAVFLSAPTVVTIGTVVLFHQLRQNETTPSALA